MNYANARANELLAFNLLTCSGDGIGPMRDGEIVLLRAARDSWIESLLTEDEFESVAAMFIREPRRASFVRWVDSLKLLHIAARERARVSDRDVPTGCVA